ncbi:hypothetical protein KIN20_014567 [Parelaphostrongylus tenuis]|uniref:SANT domain-containing protein n=1 Tax=Parelaphostrongylus tenuis TaxID=148309 RepID=A0AAD5MIJ1_PARTN|nr:hypothetical protein KIN20_014567 [Parelaphostrongylus tenuis]
MSIYEEREHALYLLQKTNFDFNIAREKVKKRLPINEEWSEDDRALFKQALLMFGKRFDKIRQMMPYRSMSSIIQFYYNTKKDSDYKSLIDIKMADDSEDDDSAEDQLNEANKCKNCGEKCRVSHFVDDVRLCFVCSTHRRVHARAIRLEYSMKTQRSDGLTDGLDSLT